MAQPSQIQQFYDNQNVFVTGGTGFLGKLLIEKLLRCTNCRCVYLLVRQKKGKSIEERLQQLFEEPLFERLKNERPDYRKRIECISGDCALENLGLNPGDENHLKEIVNVVFHVAATVRFNEDLKQAYQINVRATDDVINLCKRMKQLKSIIHVSTAYSHCYQTTIDECFYDVPIDYRNLARLLEKLTDNEVTQLTNKIIDKWPNTYAFTKALAEDLIKNETKQNHLPIGIFRPSIVISTYKEPIAGWADNLYGPSGVAAGALTGILRIFHADDDSIADLIPGDYCISALIATAWDVATLSETSKRPPPIYNYVSSVDNPLSWREYACLGHLYGLIYPSRRIIWPPNCRSIKNPNLYQILKIISHIIPGAIIDFLSILRLQKPRTLKTYQYIHRLNMVLSFFSLQSWQFSNYNTKKLWSKLNVNDRELFHFNIADVSWLNYFHSYIKGIRQYLLNDPIETLDVAKNRLWWFNKANLLLTILLNMSVFSLIYFTFRKLL